MLHQLYLEAPIELKDNTIEGVVVKYGDVGRSHGQRLSILSGAFGKIGDIVLNFQHDRKRPMARPELTDSESMLLLRATLPDTSAGRDATALIENGVMTGLSAEFMAKETFVRDGILYIKSAQLNGVGLVDKPAMPESKIIKQQHEQHNTDVQWGLL